MGKVLCAAIFADKLVGVGRKNRAYFKIGTRRDPSGKVELMKLTEDESKGYVIFNHCGVRHKRAVASAVDTVKTEGADAWVFVCNKCHKRVPVMPPILIERVGR